MAMGSQGSGCGAGALALSVLSRLLTCLHLLYEVLAMPMLLRRSACGSLADIDGRSLHAIQVHCGVIVIAARA